MKKKILFITGTRADYGKIKNIISALDTSDVYEVYLFVCGMHLLPKFGSTYKEIYKDGFKNITLASIDSVSDDMCSNVGRLVLELNSFVKDKKFDLLFLHGDRTDAISAALVGCLNNIRVAHIEGGEVSGTIDDSIRHSISKLAHFHFVCNETAKKRIIQMGEDENRIFVVGSPDIDVMLSDCLPSLTQVILHYGIKFSEYAIAMFHPVTTEHDSISNHVKNFVDCLIESQLNYIIVLPNNDYGNDLIIKEYNRFSGNKHFVLFPSIRFEYFLTLLKNALFMIGNSSAGVRETCVYGIPSIDIGSRQNNRYSPKKCPNIIHTDNSVFEIESAISRLKKSNFQRFPNAYFFGDGESSKRIKSILNEKSFWDIPIQKKFVDLD